MNNDRHTKAAYIKLSKLEGSFLAVVLFVLAAISLEFIALRLNGLMLGSIISISSALVLASSFYINNKGSFSSNIDTHVIISSVWVVLAFGIFVAYVFKSGYVLPAHDPIAVPLLAKTIISGQLPLDVFIKGSSAYSYPPGYPILFAPVMAMLPAADAYFVFKIFNIITITLIPVTWTWMQRRLFPINIPAWQMLFVSYLIFFGIERTIGFALPFAGKNAVLLGILIIPIIVVAAVHQARFKLGSIYLVFPVFGLILVHYSMLHMLAAMLGTYALLSRLRNEFTWIDILRVGLMGAIPAGLLLVLLSEALVDPRTGGFGFTPIVGAYQILDTLLSRKTFMVIYADHDFGILGFPYRGLILIFCTCLSITVAFITKTRSICYGALFYFGAFIVVLMMTFNIVPSGLANDFARWFMWAIQAGILFQAAVACVWLVHSSKGILKISAFVVVVLVMISSLTMTMLDSQVYKIVNKNQKVSRSQLQEMQRILVTASSGRDCFIISDSLSLPKVLVTVQPEKVWEYAESATSCQFMNGSWMQPGQLGGRTLDGFPSPESIKTHMQLGAVIFLGSNERLDSYTKQLSEHGVFLTKEKVGETALVKAWKLIIK